MPSMVPMNLLFATRHLIPLLLATALSGLAAGVAWGQAPLDFAIVQIRNSLAALRNDMGEVPVDRLRALLVANFYANNYDGLPAITADDQLIARKIPNASARATQLQEFYRADLNGDGVVTSGETAMLEANAFWRQNPDGSRQPPVGSTNRPLPLSLLEDRLQRTLPLDRATLLTLDWKSIAPLSVPPGLDTDGDNRIAPGEYAKTLDIALNLADLDRDGLLSEGEITAIAVRATASDTLIATAPIERLFWLE